MPWELLVVAPHEHAVDFKLCYRGTPIRIDFMVEFLLVRSKTNVLVLRIRLTYALYNMVWFPTLNYKTEIKYISLVYMTVQQLLPGVGVHPTCSVSRISSGPASPPFDSRMQYVVPGSKSAASALVAPAESA